MNRSPSTSPGGILPRMMEPVVTKALRRFPVVVLTGARQTGKSTLVTSTPLDGERLYRTLDDFDVLERARSHPDLLIGEMGRMTIDEVQRAPDLLLAIKRAVDRKRSAGQFLLTGSANLLMLRRISESLAGRAIYLHLWPMTESEKAGAPDPGPWSRLLRVDNPAEAMRSLGTAAPLSDWSRRLMEGGYPVAAQMPAPEDRSAWFEGYVRTYLERDLQDVASIGALADFRRLMRLSALRIGKILNQSELARDAGLSQPTAHRYLNLLETSCQVVRLPVFAVSRTKRLVKSPKLYWSDTGLGLHLAGIATGPRLEEHSLAGAFVENLVLGHLMAWSETVSPRPEILYWRAHTGEEVDFVIEAGQRVLPIEIKMGSRVGQSDIKSLKVFLDEYPKLAPFGMVLYGGGETMMLADRILAAPLATLLGWRA